MVCDTESRLARLAATRSMRQVALKSARERLVGLSLATIVGHRRVCPEWSACGKVAFGGVVALVGRIQDENRLGLFGVHVLPAMRQMRLEQQAVTRL